MLGPRELFTNQLDLKVDLKLGIRESSQFASILYDCFFSASSKNKNKKKKKKKKKALFGR